MEVPNIDNPISLEENNESEVFQQHDLFPSAFSLLTNFHQQEKLCDVVLKVEGKSFYVHKLVLASTIPYFQAMFVNDRIESHEKEIEMKDMDAMTLEALLKFAYSGKVILDNNNVQNIMIGASYLLLNKVENDCANYIYQRIHPQNAVDVLHFATSLNCPTLVASAEKYILWNFHEVSEHEEYLKLSLLEIKNLLSKNELFVKCEEQIFEACIRWIKHDVEKRKEHLPELLSLVRLSLLSPVYITDRVFNEDLVSSSMQCRHLLDNALALHFDPEKRASVQSFCAEPREGYVKGYMYAIRISCDHHPPSSTTFRYYDPRIEKWEKAPFTLKGRLHSEMVVIKDKLYLMGLYNEDRSSSCVDVYNSVTKEWSLGTPMLSEGWDFGATVFNDSIYVCGGFKFPMPSRSRLRSNTMERFDPRTNSWCTLAPMNKYRQNLALIACQGYIYAIGGSDWHKTFEYLDSVERYCPATNTWEEVAPMSAKRDYLGVAMFKGKLYACGGRNNHSGSLSTVEMYDPCTNKWTLVAPMNHKREGAAVAVNMGKLWAVGGRNRRQCISSMEVYDPVQDIWTNAESMREYEGAYVRLGVISFCEEGSTTYNK